MTDGNHYNYNGQAIPSEALKKILNFKLACEGNAIDVDSCCYSVDEDSGSFSVDEDSGFLSGDIDLENLSIDVDSGRVSGMIFVSERDHLEKLYIAIRFNDSQPKVKIFCIDDIYDTSNNHDVCMEDSGCFAGDYLVYVSTKMAPPRRRQPWTAVYKTNLNTAQTERLTPPGEADLNPSVSPSGKMVAVASFQGKGGWDGEIEDLKTDIFVMNVDNPSDRKLVITNGGWPSWGSDNVIFFHSKRDGFWAVFRADISEGSQSECIRVTPDNIKAMTPAAIDANTVVVATVRGNYRHIEIFDSTKKNIQITVNIAPNTDHFNPFVIDGGQSIGYHRSKTNFLKDGNHDIEENFKELGCPFSDVKLFRVSGVFPTFSKDGSKLAFVDNDFKNLWLADRQGLHKIYTAENNSIFKPVWNQNPGKNTLYFCLGEPFNPKATVTIWAMQHVRTCKQSTKQLTTCGTNNAFPSSNPQGTKLVFRSTRNGGEKGYKNLYIMENAECGEVGGTITRLTEGNWTDTHCSWSPNNDWIVFSSSREKSNEAPETDNGLDPGYFCVYLVNANDPCVVVRVFGSGDDLRGHVNHPFFSPDGRSIVVTSDFAGVSADPVSMPILPHSVRPYGDIFTIQIYPNNIASNQDAMHVKRITHSRYENTSASWTKFSTQDPHAAWNSQLESNKDHHYMLKCPYAHPKTG
ncbi:uncharacterized protein LOC115723970 isoform X1 [Cannabis sativa]|uniref:uncharacterized protein LOC115723970 isoform X1 n=1 Tax=Cannabis sativa TaxID=3483 RepID=UPI0029CAA12B|nr:uncharacterized protein LOC115723970 isoform X1 [Cannabis sativa]